MEQTSQRPCAISNPEWTGSYAKLTIASQILQNTLAEKIKATLCWSTLPLVSGGSLLCDSPQLTCANQETGI